jgi:hypothetical protein
MTAAATATPTATYTWTPLPRPTLPAQTPVVSITDRPGQDPGVGISTTPDAQETVRVRETQQSVYLTQTAGPPVTETSP